ncbi:MAG TPA: hypothetical protein VJN96_18580 [Vicinamibacterales bacterium]|nr:hypothetical protein [Vicinamibacterales bacterium]
MAPEPAQQFSEDDDDRIQLSWYARALQRHWKLALAGAIAGAAIGFGYATLQPVLYEGVTSLLVVSRTLPSGVQINPPMFGSIVRNTTVVSQVLADLKLQEGIAPQAFIDSAIDVEEVAGTSIVKLKVRLADPRVAAEASRRLAEGALAFAQQLSADQGDQSPNQLKGQVDEARDRRHQAEADLLAYQAQAQVELLKEDTDRMLKDAKPAGEVAGRLNELHKRQVEVAHRQADLDLATRLYADAARAYERSRTLSVGKTPPLQILDRAVPADHPVSRKRLKSTVAGSVAGFLGAALVGLLLQTRVRPTAAASS